MHRRELLGTAVSASAAALFSSEQAVARDKQAVGAEPAPPARIVDSNISLFQWPFRRLPLDDTASLVAKLRELGIVEAWAGSFEAILHRDLGGVNSRLADECRAYAELVPVGCVNPTSHSWEVDLRRCVEDHGMPGVRLHPNYHGYTLRDDRFHRLLRLATEMHCFVQIAVAMEDIRTQHALIQAADVDLRDLPTALIAESNARVQLLNGRPKASEIKTLTREANLFVDTARLESTDGISTALKLAPAGRVLFGSHAPFLIPEAALIRVRESRLENEQRNALLQFNARRYRDLIGGPGQP